MPPPSTCPRILLVGAGAPLRSAMIFFYLANEGLSILENLAALGVPIPKRLKQVVADLGEEDPPPDQANRPN